MSFEEYFAEVNSLVDRMSLEGYRWHIRVEEPEQGLTFEFRSVKGPRR